MPIEHQRYFTIDEYLAFERDAQEKHEFRDGEIIAMAGGTYDHGQIIVNILVGLHAGLKGSRCHVHESNTRVRVMQKAFYCYPDAMVIRGPPQFDEADKGRQTVTNPRFVVEVLSPSTEGYDRGDQFTRYRDIESFEEYVLISADKAMVQVYFRQKDGNWLFTPAAGLEAIARFHSINVELPLAEIYAGVEFPPPPPEEAEIHESDAR